MVRGADERRVGARVAQHLLDIVVGVGDLEAGGERVGLGGIVVADGRDLDPLEAPQRGEMGDLGDGAGAHHDDAHQLAHRVPAQR